jgi:hypothetical protein
VTRTGPSGETMTIGFIHLSDLNTMYQEMGQRFFERNIRAALSGEAAVNRSIQQSLKRVLDGKEDPKVFAFNHNGVTLSAEALSATTLDSVLPSRACSTVRRRWRPTRDF